MGGGILPSIGTPVVVSSTHSGWDVHNYYYGASFAIALRDDAFRLAIKHGWPATVAMVVTWTNVRNEDAERGKKKERFLNISLPVGRRAGEEEEEKGGRTQRARVRIPLNFSPWGTLQCIGGCRRFIILSRDKRRTWTKNMELEAQ